MENQHPKTFFCGNIQRNSRSNIKCPFVINVFFCNYCKKFIFTLSFSNKMLILVHFIGSRDEPIIEYSYRQNENAEI